MPCAKIQLYAKSWISPTFCFWHWPACLSINNELLYLGHTHLTARSWLILGRLIRQPFTQCPLLPIAQYIWLRMINVMVYIWLQSPCQCQQLQCVNISHWLYKNTESIFQAFQCCVTWGGGTPIRKNQKQMGIVITSCFISERNEKVDTYGL